LQRDKKKAVAGWLFLHLLTARVPSCEIFPARTIHEFTAP